MSRQVRLQRNNFFEKSCKNSKFNRNQSYLAAMRYSLFTLHLIAWGWCAYGQIILGNPGVVEQSRGLFLHSDGTFIVVGTSANKSVLYKVTCDGRVLATLSKIDSLEQLILYEATEMPDKSIVAVGQAVLRVNDSTTLKYIALLKTDPNLKELGFRIFQLSGKESWGYSAALAPNGDLLVAGEIKGFSLNFTDIFLVRVDPNTLQPVGTNFSIYDYGVDYRPRLTKVGANKYLLSFSAYTGNIFNSNAFISSKLVTLKVDADGQVIWEHVYAHTRKQPYGLFEAARALPSSLSGSLNTIVCSAVHHPNAVDSLTDAVFFLLGPDGSPLDTLLVPLPNRQELGDAIGAKDFPGAVVAAGRTMPSSGFPTALLLGVLEVGSTLQPGFVINDTTITVGLSSVIEVPFGRIAVLGNVPESIFGWDMLLLPPELGDIRLNYQNCAFSATFSVPGLSYQWYRDGLAIPGATGGIYKPTQAGRYHVKITDAFGCSGLSDTIAITWPEAKFSYVKQGLTVVFENNSSNALSYEWDFGDSTRSIATNPTHTYTTKECYLVTLIARDECHADTVQETICVTNTHEDVKENLLCRVVPNPNKGTFTLMLSGKQAAEEVVFSLFYPDGRLLDRQLLPVVDGQVQHTMAYANLSPGLYTGIIQSGAFVKAIKITVY